MAEVKFKDMYGDEIVITEQDVISLTQGDTVPTQKECIYFMNKCKAEKANPFLNELMIFKFNGYPASFIMTQELMLKRAREAEDFSGIADGIFVIDLNNTLAMRQGVLICPGETLIGGWAKVYVKGIREPFYEAFPVEYYNAQHGLWNSMPGVMIRKVARVAALRAAFPRFSGNYAPEELNSPQIQDAFSYDEQGNITGLKNQSQPGKKTDSIPEINPVQTANSASLPENKESNSNSPVNAIDQEIKSRIQTVTPVVSPQPVDNLNRSGIAGNPASIPQMPEEETMTYAEAIQHVGENGTLKGISFSNVLTDTTGTMKVMLEIYANSMTGNDRIAAKVILDTLK